MSAAAVTTELLLIPNETLFELEKTTVPLVAVCDPAAPAMPPPPAALADSDIVRPLLFIVIDAETFVPPNAVLVPAMAPEACVCTDWLDVVRKFGTPIVRPFVPIAAVISDPAALALVNPVPAMAPLAWVWTV